MKTKITKECIDDLSIQQGIDVVALMEETLAKQLNLAITKELRKKQKAEKQKIRKNKLKQII